MTLACMIALPAACTQDLGALARREAERRREVDASGTVAREIGQPQLQDAARGARVATFTRSGEPPAARAPLTRASSQEVARYRAALLRLDRQIAGVEDRVAVLRARAEAERDTPVRSRRHAGRARGDRAPPGHELAIREQELKLRRLRRERSETYEAGRRAGHLPGELDGKGVFP